MSKRTTEQERIKKAKYRAKYPERFAEYHRKYNEANREKINEYQKNYVRMRRATDPEYRERMNAYSRQYQKTHRKQIATNWTAWSKETRQERLDNTLERYLAELAERFPDEEPSALTLSNQESNTIYISVEEGGRGVES